MNPLPAMYFYQKHVFFCLNERAEDCESCAQSGAVAAHAHAKKRLQSLKQHGPGMVRINKAGCLDRCSEGPVLVVYPEGRWYQYVDTADIDEIINEDLLAGRPVARLLL
jgi:(2Fe-2S) ferredoxin